jgi:hypothetical protein
MSETESTPTDATATWWNDYLRDQAELSQKHGQVWYAFDVRVDDFETYQPTFEVPPVYYPTRWALYADKRWVEQHADYGDYYEAGTVRKLSVGDEAQLDSLTQARNDLNNLVQQGELDSAMQWAETLAVTSGLLDPDRQDPRLFTEGPPDCFTTRGNQDTDVQATPSLSTDPAPEDTQPIITGWNLDL